LSDAARVVDAVWRVEGARIVAAVAAATGDLGLAEDVAQEAVLEALTSWAGSGVPANPGAWLTTVARRRAVDAWRRRGRLAERYAAIADTLDEASDDPWQPIGDEVLRLVFTACHPALSRESQVALTLRVVSGLSTEEIARLLLTSVPTIQARITRAKKSLRAAGIQFAAPEPSEWGPRLTGVLGVVYLLFTEGYAATSGERWVRPDLADEAIRLGRVIVALLPREPEALGLLALMEFQRSRFAARERADGSAVPLEAQDRSRWDRGQIARAIQLRRRAAAAAEARGTGPGPYALQAAIAECHATARDIESTDWRRIVELYDRLGRIAPGPIVELNRIVALAMADGPGPALGLLGRLDEARGIAHLLPGIRGEFLARLGRRTEAIEQLRQAVELAQNAAQRRHLAERIAALED